ncbi:MAG: class I SAM-dependent DNA methyltransferase [Henriciella sp.]|uniref:type I restriction-modification system subunit M n=1 Tax=Henriciella sp. TaxID=1968823 RepID=UPI0032EBDD6E
MSYTTLSAEIWSVADLLRGDYKQSQYGRVILPFAVLRRLDCVLEPTKRAALAEYEKRTAEGLSPEPFLLRTTGAGFYNTSRMTLKALTGDQDNIAANLHAYIDAFPDSVRDIFDRFKFAAQIDTLSKNGLLYQVTEKFAQFDLHPDRISNMEMGLAFEELIRKFAEASNDTAGEHFTPREVIKLMVSLIFVEDDDVLSKPGVVRTIYDPTAGTGGMLSVADEYLAEHNKDARLTMFGQELNDESYAICKADMLIKGQDISNIKAGNTLSDDGHSHTKFDYMLSNPPFGVEWKKVQKEVQQEHKDKGYDGRFGPGLPRVSDGSLLFLMHLLSKMRPAKDGGSRFAIVLNGSPLFTGGAGSGESEIRRHVLESDLVEAIIALPTDMFYNTGIATYIWVLSNKKPQARRGKVQLIDGSSFWEKMRKSLGSKRRQLSEAHIEDLTQLFGQFVEAELATVLDVEGKEVAREIMKTGSPAPAAPHGGKVKRAPLSLILPNEAFGYRQITVERPQLDEAGQPVLASKGRNKGEPIADTSLRDTETVPLTEEVEAYFEREVIPHVPDAWIDHDKTKVGYEIPFNRHFYVFEPPRQLEEIDRELKATTDKIKEMLEGLHA